MQVAIVFFDLAKAFDTVLHALLIDKLGTFGVNGTLLNWFHSYLTDRRQRVVTEGWSSGWFSVTFGVPQGSILGPLQFLMYINDMPDWVTSSLALFADDTVFPESEYNSRLPASSDKFEQSS